LDARRLRGVQREGDCDGGVSPFQFLAGAELDFGRDQRVDSLPAIAFDERRLGLPKERVVPISAAGTIARLRRYAAIRAFRANAREARDRADDQSKRENQTGELGHSWIDAARKVPF
jgi:hypothetical protein